MNKEIEKEFDEKFFGNGKFPKRITDPILCDEIKDWIGENFIFKKELASELEKMKPNSDTSKLESKQAHYRVGYLNAIDDLKQKFGV